MTADAAAWRTSGEWERLNFVELVMQRNHRASVCVLHASSNRFVSWSRVRRDYVFDARCEGRRGQEKATQDLAAHPGEDRSLDPHLLALPRGYFFTTNTLASTESSPRNTTTLYVPTLSPLGFDI